MIKDPTTDVEYLGSLRRGLCYVRTLLGKESFESFSTASASRGARLYFMTRPVVTGVLTDS